MKSPIQKRVHFINEVALPSLTFQSTPHCEQWHSWLGGELVREVIFLLLVSFFMIFILTISCLYCMFKQSPFCMISGLLLFISEKAENFVKYTGIYISHNSSFLLF